MISVAIAGLLSMHGLCFLVSMVDQSDHAGHSQSADRTRTG
jgi:hypothetical protein